MFDLLNIFSKKNKGLSREEIIDLLKMNPHLFDQFEQNYKSQVLDNEEPDDFFATNSRQMAESKETNVIDDEIYTENLQQRIVDEFLAETPVYTYKRSTTGKGFVEIKNATGLPNNYQVVTRDDLKQVSIEIRPQCTSTLQKRDIVQKSYMILLDALKRSMTAKTEKERKQWYHLFRQGLDILDIDSIMYDILGMNQVSIGYWLPKIVKSVDDEGFFKIPSTTIIKVPMNILQLTRTDYELINKTTLGIVDKFCYKAFNLKDDGDYFIKTGTYSSKFDFRNCRVVTPKEVRELGEYLLFIHTQACQMAAPLNTDKNGKPLSIYGVSTTNEWCVREYISDVENNPSIYKGLPLHTEYRAFFDFDTEKVLGIFPYWDPVVMQQRFEGDADHSVHSLHDYMVFKAHENILMQRFFENKDLVEEHLKFAMRNTSLEGQWSIDIMQNGDDFWLIDMATAETSAFYNYLPDEVKKTRIEKWLPELDENGKLKDNYFKEN